MEEGLFLAAATGLRVRMQRSWQSPGRIVPESRKESVIRLPESMPGVATVVLGRNFF